MTQRAIEKPKTWVWLVDHHAECRDRAMASAKAYKAIGDTERTRKRVIKARYENHCSIGYKKLLTWWD